MLQTNLEPLYCGSNIHAKCSLHQHQMLEYQSAEKKQLCARALYQSFSETCIGQTTKMASKAQKPATEIAISINILLINDSDLMKYLHAFLPLPTK